MIPILYNAHKTKDIPQHYGVQLFVNSKQGIATLRNGESLRGWLSQHKDHPLYALSIVSSEAVDDVCLSLRILDIKKSVFVYDLNYISLKYFRCHAVPIAERVSEEERFQEYSHLIWMDRWNWHDTVHYSKTGMVDEREMFIYTPPKNCVGDDTMIYAVSPDLHLFDTNPSWREYQWRSMFDFGVDGICTQYPNELEDVYTKWSLQ